jgi:hypothetical protein
MGRVAEAAVLNPHPGLVGWWRFDEGNGTVAGDSSGNGNNGTIYGATWVAGKYGYALNFSTSAYLFVNPLKTFNPNSDFTILCWFKTSSTVGSRVLWYLPNVGEAYMSGSGFFRIFWFGSAPFVSPDTASGYNDGNWHNLVVKKTSTLYQIFIDNSLTSSTNSSTVYSGSLSLYVSLSTNSFLGCVDEVRIYNRALSAAEMQADFQEGPDFSVNLLAKVPKGTTQVITTLSWQGTGSINVTIVSPSQNYTESMLSEYQKTVYSTSGGTTSMLNIKRLSVSVSALSSDQNWYIVLTFNNVNAYQISVEVQS